MPSTTAPPCVALLKTEGMNQERGGCNMKLNAPTQTMWLIAVIIGVIGIIGKFGVLTAAVAGYAFWLVAIAFAILALTTMMKGA